MFPNWLHKKSKSWAEAPSTETDEISEQDFEDGGSDDEELENDDFEEEDLDSILKRVYEWGHEWSESPLFVALTQEQKDEAESITGFFTQYMYEYHGVAPEAWNVNDLEECCVDTLPRKVTAEDSFFRSIAPVLSSFFIFLDQSGRLRHAAKLAAQVRRLDKQIVRAASDPRNWGMAKSFAMQAMAAGVDLNDKDQMDRFVIQHNAEMAARRETLSGLSGGSIPPPSPEPAIETFERGGPKIGRNDPCPCGSGKKYKKCCGA